MIERSGSSGHRGHSAWLYPVVRLLFDEEGSFLGDIRDKLAGARMSTTAELYVAQALAVGLILGTIFWGVGLFIGYSVFILAGLGDGPLLGAPVPSEEVLVVIETIRAPGLIFLTGVILGTLGFTIGSGGYLSIPYLRAGGRKREINMLLPDAISFMYALSIGGLNQIEIIETMAQAEDTYGEVSREFQTIVQETEYFDIDYRTAIRNQAFVTPSDELSQFFTDLLSILNSGGDLSQFLEDKKDKHMRTAKQEQELTLDTLELFGEMYMTLSLFPLLLIIILVIMSLLGEASEFMLYVTVYALIPLIGAGFLVMISTVKRDEPGDGYLTTPRASARPDGGNVSGKQSFNGSRPTFQIFDRIYWRTKVRAVTSFFRRPHQYFKESPLATIAFTIPLSVILVLGAVASGMAPLTMEGQIDSPVWATFIWLYLPLYVICLPLAVFHEWNVRSRYAVLNDLSDSLRKLSSANNTGQTLLESIETVSETSENRLADEFATMRAKVAYGTNLGTALVEFNNSYHIPRLARTVKLIEKAQEASSQITNVLNTAAQASENQDDIDRERRSRTRMQVVIIVMTYLTLLAVMAILQVQFLEVLGGMVETPPDEGAADAGMEFGAGVDVNLLSMMFFHAVTMQAILSGLICGYIRDASMLSGVKYVIVLVTVALGVWTMVG